MPAKKNSRTEKRAEPENRTTRNPLLWVGSIVLLVLIVAAFVGGPLIGGAATPGTISFGSYAGKAIEYYPGNYLANQQQFYADQYAGQADSSNTTMVLFQIWRQAFEETVVHMAMLDAAERAGLQVTDEFAARDLKEQYDQAGEGAWENFLERADSIERQSTLENNIERLRHEQVITDLVAGARLSSAEKEFLSNMARTERSFSYVSYSAADYPASEIIAYGTENSTLFSQMQLSRITIKSSAREAEEVRAQLVADPTRFGELARSLSTDGFADQGGEMGLQSYFVLQQDFEDPADLDAVFALAKGDFSPVLETSFGWVIYRADEEATLPDFANTQTLALVSSYINRYEKGRIIDYLSERAEFFRTRALEAGMETAADDADKNLATTVAFPINFGGSPLLKDISNQNEAIFARGMSNESFLTQLFSLEEGEVSEVLTLDDYVLVAQLAEETELEESTVTQMGEILAFYLQQLEREELYRYYLDSDELQDEFASAFQRLFLSN
jgi:peptidyl-prolyl cis-trans isomerase D